MRVRTFQFQSSTSAHWDVDADTNIVAVAATSSFVVSTDPNLTVDLYETPAADQQSDQLIIHAGEETGSLGNIEKNRIQLISFPVSKGERIFVNIAQTPSALQLFLEP